jgi:hypothetical protein
MKIRFLDIDQPEPYFWVNRNRDRAPIECPACDAGLPVRKVHMVNAVPVIGYWLPELKHSKNRSKRVWKKLIRRQSKPMYGKPVVVVL